MRYAVTGPVELTAKHQREYAVQVLIEQLGELRGAGNEFTSGAAEGFDTLAALYVSLLPDDLFSVRRLTVPAAYFNHKLVKELSREGWIIERAPRGRDTSDTYMRRNDLTVSHADVLIACPPNAVEVKRGGPGAGTWATVRRARKAGCEIRVFPLDGSKPWVEPSTKVRLPV